MAAWATKAPLEIAQIRAEQAGSLSRLCPVHKSQCESQLLDPITRTRVLALVRLRILLDPYQVVLDPRNDIFKDVLLILLVACWNTAIPQHLRESGVVSPNRNRYQTGGRF